MADHGRLLRQLADHAGEVVGDLADGLAGEDLGVRVRLLDGLGIVGPTRRQRREARLLEDGDPPVPAARQQPEPVDEDDGREAGGVRPIDLLCGHAAL